MVELALGDQLGVLGFHRLHFYCVLFVVGVHVYAFVDFAESAFVDFFTDAIFGADVFDV